MNTKITIWDISALNLWVNLNSKVNYIFIVLAGGLSFWFSAMPKLSMNDIFYSIIITIASFGAGVFLIVAVTVPIILIFTLSNYLIKDSMGEISYSFEVTEIIENTSSGKNSYPYMDIKNVHLTGKYILVRTSYLRYLMIPKRSFSDELQFYKLYLELKRKCV